MNGYQVALLPLGGTSVGYPGTSGREAQPAMTKKEDHHTPAGPQARVRLTLFLLVALLVAPGLARAGEERLRDIVASGTGKTAEAAVHNAQRNAVEQVVNAYVHAAGNGVKDDIVREQILTLSDRYVERYALVGAAATDTEGLVRVRIRAKVRETELLGRLTEAKLVGQPVDGETMFTQWAIKSQASRSARLLRKMLEELEWMLL